MNGFERMRKQLVAALRDHLARPKVKPRIPDAGAILWQALVDLDAGRSVHANGPCPISLAEAESRVRLKRCPLELRHIEMIMALDAEMVAPKSRNRPAMTPALFDARFL